ncbi:MAG TPA: hypothetical protein VGH56_08470 [Solirubrobacteraceae bacterium]
MNHSTGGIRPPRTWPCAARTAAAIIATAVLALPAAAFGGGPPATIATGLTNARASTRSQSGVQKALAYSRCMRAHGVPRFPDPNSIGAIPKRSLQQLGVSSTVFQAAQQACQHLLPNSGQSSQAWDQTALNALWRFARCVRANGVPNWPDPLAESDPGQPGTPGFPRNLPPGINTNSPVVKNAMNKCQHLLAGIGYGSGGYP